jgi:hypothetical protein
MRQFLVSLLLCSLSFAQPQTRSEGPDFSRAARPRGWFYLNGIGHQYLQGTDYTVVAAAIPVLNGRFFGVKLRIINRGNTSANVLPESITAEDSVGAKQLVSYSSSEVNDKMQKPSGWVRFAGMAAGEPIGVPAAGGGGVPTMANLVRELMKEASAENPWGGMDSSYPVLIPRGAATATTSNSPACDLGCQLRNREIGDGNGPQLQRRSVRPEQVEQSELLANTVSPGSEIEGILYFAMPKMTDRAPISQNGRKSFRVTVTVPLGEEKFQFVFPPEW